MSGYAGRNQRRPVGAPPHRLHSAPVGVAADAPGPGIEPATLGSADTPLLAACTLAPAQQRELIAYRDQLNPAAIAREIADIQAVLLNLAQDKTE